MLIALLTMCILTKDTLIIRGTELSSQIDKGFRLIVLWSRYDFDNVL